MKQYLNVDKQKPGSSVVYWIRRPEYTDVFSQGYVGITCKPVKERWSDHSRASKQHNGIIKNAIKGDKDVIYEVILVAQDRAYCQKIEKLLRPKENIGWNLSVGGDVVNSKLGGQTNRLRHIKEQLLDVNKACQKWWDAERKMLKRQAIEARKKAKIDFVPFTGERKISKRNNSGYTGVTWFKNYQLWRSQLMVDGKLKCLGYFKDVKDAAQAYKEAKEAKVRKLKGFA
jgi:hypothetical protein